MRQGGLIDALGIYLFVQYIARQEHIDEPCYERGRNVTPQ